MERMIFINLPVTDLPRSIAFYTALGATQNHQFSNAEAAMMAFSPAINVMLLTHRRFGDFSPLAIPDARTSAQMLLCLSAGSRADVDNIIAAGAGAGGSTDPCPVQDMGFMFGRSVSDPDGHIWEVMWMDLAAVPADIASLETA